MPRILSETDPTPTQKSEARWLLSRLHAHYNIAFNAWCNRVGRARTKEELESCLVEMRRIQKDLDMLPQRLKGRETLI